MISELPLGAFRASRFASYCVVELGDSDKAIGLLDAAGVALAAIQGLNAKLTEQSALLVSLQNEVPTLKNARAKRNR